MKNHDAGAQSHRTISGASRGPRSRLVVEYVPARLGEHLEDLVLELLDRAPTVGDLQINNNNNNNNGNGNGNDNAARRRSAGEG